ncbi:MAG: GNAT family N-acetyltransferase [Candidatus Melainabacteria bacterium]|nr:GNAT family N-acetyltransferase [Candidatus Melainabacteria bacterium]
MNLELLTNNLVIEKASQSDWKSILKLLEETRLTRWFSGKENYKNFFVIKDSSDNNSICCFAIEFENKIGILKSFAVRKDLQGKGIGKFITNKIPEICKKLGIRKLYAASSESPDFWRKTIFKEVQTNEIKEPYAVQYINFIKSSFPKEFQCSHFFLLVLD